MNETIKDQVGDAAMYMQLAEECTELAFACIKKARKLGGVNPTPKTMEEIDAAINEEVTDVALVCSEIGLIVDHDQLIRKQKRWRERLCGSLN